MPLAGSIRSAPVPPIPLEQTRREIATRVLERVETMVEKAVRRHFRFDSKEVRRLGEKLYSDLGSRIVFERERLGRS
jgi:hypothetical protein